MRRLYPYTLIAAVGPQWRLRTRPAAAATSQSAERIAALRNFRARSSAILGDVRSVLRTSGVLRVEKRFEPIMGAAQAVDDLAGPVEVLASSLE